MKKKIAFCLLIGMVLVEINIDFSFARVLNLDYSTYLGGRENDNGHGISVSSNGLVYITGSTSSLNFPTQNTYQAVDGKNTDAFVSVLTSTGSAVFYSTYLGGGGNDTGYEISLGSNGMAYVTGYTSSSNFPTKNPYQMESGGSTDAFVTALSSTGATLFYSSYIGGSESDYGYGIVVGSNNTAFITGITYSSDFPLKNPWDSGYSGYGDAFVTALSSSGSLLSYSTYLGGNAYDQSRGISLGPDGSAYVTGRTLSPNFPIENPYQAVYGGYFDIFVSALSSSGSSLSYSTYLGGSNFDEGYGIMIGTNGTAYITGYTESTDFPTVNPYQAEHAGGIGDVFVMSISSSGSTLSYSTYLGGNHFDIGYGISIGSDGTAYVAGLTYSTNFPTKNPYQSSNAGKYYGSDVFLSVLTSSGATICYSTYLGGRSDDYGSGISLGTNCACYITGCTTAPDFPTVNPYQAGHGGGSRDVFVSKFTIITTPTPAPAPTCSYMVMASGDYTGDGAADIAIFRQQDGLWAIRGLGRTYFGRQGDYPAPGDYNGDSLTDVAIFRPATGLWAVKYYTRFYFGAGPDLPGPADYDGDGTCDAAVFRDDDGRWSVRGITRRYFGTAGDLPVPGDYDGDGTTDMAIFREATGLWAVNGQTRFYYGRTGDRPVPGIYKWSGALPWLPAIFRPTSGLWAIRSTTRFYYGQQGDTPVVGNFTGNALDNSGIFRGDIGLWDIRGLTRVYYGREGDLPVSR